MQFDSPLAPERLEIHREMFSDYHLKIANDYSISIVNVKKLIANFFDKENYMLHYKNLQLYFRLGLKIKITLCIRISSIKMAKTIYRI